MSDVSKLLKNISFFSLLLTVLSLVPAAAQNAGRTPAPSSSLLHSRLASAGLTGDEPADPWLPPASPAFKTGGPAESPLAAPAAGSVDTSFATNFSYYPGYIRAVAFQADGKMIAGGFFRRINGEEHFNLARFNTDGTLDASFTPKVSDYVYAVAIQPDGKIVIGGGFFKVNGVGRNHIARLNADGSLDTGFNPGAGASSNVYSLAVQPDGKILAGGVFSVYDGFAANRLMRLNPDGSRDFTFAVTLDDNGAIYSLSLQPDGKVLAGGNFSSSQGPISSYKLALY